ncbi:hypothetical protein [Planktotalea sp.]|uniref:hypothetical protein n=1 Tax=Planktotalea sp. TaxID=2029877 RepID=UPI003D6C4763
MSNHRQHAQPERKESFTHGRCSPEEPEFEDSEGENDQVLASMLGACILIMIATWAAFIWWLL